MTDDARRRTALATVAVAALLATAGCAGVFGGDGATTPTPDDPGGPGTATATDPGGDGGDGGTAAGDLPPGVSGDGVDAAALVAAHEESLLGESFENRLTLDRTQSRGDQSRRQRIVQTNRLGEDGTYLTRFNQTAGMRIVQTTWGNDSVALSNVTLRDRTQYQRRDPAVVRPNLTASPFVEQFVRMGDYAVEGRDGATVTLTANGPAADAGMGPNRTVERYEGTVVVDSEGRIQRMDVEVVVVADGGTRTELTVRFGLVDVGETTVERPGWVPEAVEAVSGSGGS